MFAMNIMNQHDSNGFCSLRRRSFHNKLLHDCRGLAKELVDKKIKYVVNSGRNMNELSVEKLIHIVAAGISVYPPLSSQLRGIDANVISAGILLSGAYSNVMGLMNYYVKIDRVEYATDDKVIKILWQTVRGEDCWDIFHDMEYFTEDSNHLTEILGGRDALNDLPDFYADIREKCKEVCHNGLIMKMGFTSGTLHSPPMIHGNNCWKLRNMGAWPTCPMDQFGSDVIDDSHMNNDLAILGDSIFRYFSYYGSGRNPV